MKGEQTRRRLLHVTRGLLEENRGVVSMAEVASHAGVTRQLLYVHFASRADLLAEVLSMVDAEVRTPALQALVDDAPDGRDALRQAVRVQGRIKPRIDGLVSAVDHARLRDPDLAKAWQEREQARLDRLSRVVSRLEDESLLREEWTVATAARSAWAATSQHSWQALVRDGDWTTRRWVGHVSQLLDLALCEPAG